ncbi:MAG: sulfatase-like hydrolase/transferase, partial [Planctomycetales bacterium]|nr:sulfatase-like hydrolase/transferase [Planctomycetales bacterium]
MRILVLLLNVSLMFQASVALDAVAANPNIVLIMADDVSWEAFGCYGAEDYQTPNLDAMASAGMRFNHCYSTPICTTSRVQLMTGKYNFRNYTHFGYLAPQEKTFGNLLQAAGYKTVVAGKWQLNGLYNSLPRHLDSSRPYAAGFDEFCLWQLTKGKAPTDGGGERFWSPPLEKNSQFLSAEDNLNLYGPDILCEFLCDFMERHRSEPFLVYYPMLLVHDPFVPTPDTIGDDGKATRDQSANLPAKDRGKENFVAMVQYMDKIVGRLLDKVEQLGIADNTIILFTADNGTNTSITSRWNGREIRGGKAGLTDTGTHVPLIAYWKGHTPVGTVCDDLVDFTDFYPTIAEAAGIELAESDPF